MTKLVISLVLALFVTAAGAQTVTDLAPASPQPAAADLAPGLAVLYFGYLGREVEDLESYDDGRVGPPLANLDWDMGDGDVLTSGRSIGVGARITGFIRFPQAGVYQLVMNSNDGIKLVIADQPLIMDPTVHGDRFSDIASVNVPSAGWYPLLLHYFQRKGTATLQLFWQPPGGDRMVIVPAEHLAHSNK